MAWRRWVFPGRGTVDEQGVVGPAGYLGHGLGGRVGEAVRRRGDEGVEGEPGSSWTEGVSRLAAALRATERDCARLWVLSGRAVFGSGQAGWRLSLAHLELDGDVPPATVAKVSWIMGKKRDDTRSRTTALGTESVRTEPRS